jgi:hypothetical protein
MKFETCTVVSNVSKELAVYIFNIRRVFTLHKRRIRIMSGVGARSSRKNLLKKPDIIVSVKDTPLCLEYNIKMK